MTNAPSQIADALKERTGQISATGTDGSTPETGATQIAHGLPLILLLSIFLLAPAARGANFTVVCDGNQVASLRNAINSANVTGGTIQLSGCDFDFFNADSGGVNSALPKITGTITIAGTGTDKIRRDANSTFYRLFYVAAGGSLTVQNLSISNGWGQPGANGSDQSGASTSGLRGDDGAGIDNHGTLQVNGVTFTDNRAGPGGSGEDCDNSLGGHTGFDGGPGGNGGAIHNAGTATVQNSTFNADQFGNQGGHGGNGGNCQGTDFLSIARSAGSGGVGGQGGAIRNDPGATLLVQGCKFLDNDAGQGGDTGMTAGSNNPALGGPGGSGGAIESEGSLTIQDSSIDSNHAGQGGASSLQNGAGGSGGGVAALGGGLSVLRSSFTSNETGVPGSGNGAEGNGGGILTGVNTTIQSSTFSLNTLHGCPNPSGGGIYVKGSVTVALENSTMDQNVWDVNCGGGTFGLGASIFAETHSTVHLANSILLSTTTNPGNCAGGGTFIDDSKTHNLTWSLGVDVGMTPGPGNQLGCPATVLTADPKLGARTDPTLGPVTETPDGSSPATNGGDNSTCVAFDERNVTRPQGPACDIGAVEARLSIVANPADTTVASGHTASFAATYLSDDLETVQWQVSTNGGTTWSAAPLGSALSSSGPNGSTINTYTTPIVVSTNNLNKYRLKVTSPVVPSGVFSSGATLNVQYGPLILIDLPTVITANVGQNFQWTFDSDGNPAFSTLWEVSTDGGVTWANAFGSAIVSIGGTGTFSLTATTAMFDATQAGHSWRYRATLTGLYPGAPTVVSKVARIDVTNNPLPVSFNGGLQNPLPWVDDRDTFMFFNIVGNPPPTVGWQRSLDSGITWIDLVNSPDGYTFNTTAPSDVAQIGFKAESIDDGAMYRSVLNEAVPGGAVFSPPFTGEVMDFTTTAVNCPPVVHAGDIYQCTATVVTNPAQGARTRKPSGLMHWAGPVLNSGLPQCGLGPGFSCSALDENGTSTMQFMGTDPDGSISAITAHYPIPDPFHPGPFADDFDSEATVDVLNTDCVLPVITTCPPPQIDGDGTTCAGAVPDFTATTLVSSPGCTPVFTQDPPAGTMFSAIGNYQVQVTATTEAGSASCVTTFTIGTVPPAITLQGDDPYFAECGTFVDPGESAVDNCGNPVPVFITFGDVDPSTPGVYTIAYGAIDGSNNRASATRTVVVQDTTPPVINLNSSSTIAIPCHSSFDDPAMAEDECAGFFPPDISGLFDPNTPGTYTLNYNATDPSGNHAALVQRTIIVFDITPPTITLNGPSPLITECHSPFVDPGATVVDDCAGILVASASSNVDPNTPGLYTVNYDAVDPSGNHAVQAHRTVVVQDRQPPVIVLNGPDPTVIECHGSYVEQGATALDACTGPVSPTISGIVDPTTPGSYTITYNASDTNGNVSTPVTRTVVVQDSTPPTIALNGPNPITISCHGAFTDPGAVATDVCAGTFPATATGMVDPSTPGMYTITYHASDPANNAATPVTRTVFVTDMVPPTLALNGSSTINLECHAPFTDPGAIATDACAGTFAATPSGPVDPNTVGTYTITYNASDPSGNAATPITRTVVVGDSQPPVISLNGADPLIVECHTLYIEPGATANDACAGAFAATASGLVEPNTLGTYTVTYSAMDPSGNAAATVKRTVNVTDTTAPTIALTGAAVMTVECHGAFVDPGAIATDSCAGTFAATASGSVDPNHPGSYTLTYNASDPSGNHAIAVTRTVNVLDTTAPLIALNGASVMNVECHTPFTDPGAVATDACAGTFAATGSGTVDPNTVGIYTLSYNAADPSGNNATTVTRTVNVVDTTKPVISLNGADPVIVECHSLYVEQGATANDSCAGPFAATPSGPVDANTVGTYTVTYNAMDPSGNGATPITRTVDVVDTTPPVISLNGASVMTVECHGAFSDPGAVATDACAGSFAATSSGSVDPNHVGSYTLTYSAVDPSGNHAILVTRTVNVTDTAAPLITLNGSSTMTVECHTLFTDPGALATDACAGTFGATATGLVDPNTVGSYTLTYNAGDPSGNHATPVTRTVNVVDTTAPLITLNGADPQIVECHTSYVEQGALASDACAGTSAATPSGLVDPNTVGSYTITYNAVDPSGNHAVAVTRTVNVTDTRPPVIALNGSGTLTVECHTGFSDPGAVATDDCAGTFAATATGTVDPNTVGSYTLTYNASDPSGNHAVAITRTVNVTDTTPPVITVNVPATPTVECHTSYTDAGASALDSCAGIVPVISSGSVDVNTPGTYTITYSAVDLYGNHQTATRSVQVSDTQPPTIAITGANPMTVESHSPFTDPGAVATDSCAGSFAATAAGTVDPNTLGIYTITYNAADPSANPATPVTRTVDVVDTTPPTITACPQPAAAFAGASCVAMVPDFTSQARATDLGSPQIQFSQSPAAGTMLGTGVHPITITATDGSNNVSTCSTTFTVTNNTPPTLSCPTNITAPDVPGSCEAPVTYEATATDICGGVSLSYNHRSGSEFPVGATQITATATDQSGNNSSCQFLVTVLPSFTSSSLDAPPAPQYGDQIVLTSHVSEDGTASPLTGGTVTFLLDTVALGTSPVTSGQSTLDVALTDPSVARTALTPGNHTVTSTFGGTSCTTNSIARTEITIARRAASLAYNGDLSHATHENNAPVSLSAAVIQNQNSAANLTNAIVTFKLYSATNVSRTRPDFTFTAGADAGGVAQTPVTLPLGKWTVIVSFDPASFFAGPDSQPKVIDVTNDSRRHAVEF